MWLNNRALGIQLMEENITIRLGTSMVKYCPKILLRWIRDFVYTSKVELHLNINKVINEIGWIIFDLNYLIFLSQVNIQWMSQNQFNMIFNFNENKF